MGNSLLFRAAVVGGIVTATAGLVVADRWRRSWGVDPAEAERPFPGDDLIPDPAACETRGITIDAPPDEVWPWLVQMGFGRGGWYSYDQLDMQGRSASAIVPEWQALAVGDVVPTDPGGGFEVKVLDPGRALVLSVDGEAVAARERRPAPRLPIRDAPGLAASGRFLDASMPRDFAATWAFVLQPMRGRRTRLVERLRLRVAEASPGSRVMGPALAFGMFVMLRKQLLGIRERAERLAHERELGTWTVTPHRTGTPRADVATTVA